MMPRQGSLSLAFERRGNRTVPARNRRHGPIPAPSPFHPGDGACHVCVLHPPGGLVGGDRLTLDVQAGGSARALLATPAAAKFCRTVGLWARQARTVRAVPGRAGAAVVDDLPVLRAPAPGISGLRRWLHGWLHGLWAELHPPLLGVEPHPPRIWATRSPAGRQAPRES